MKIGDKVPVQIGPHQVAMAEVKEIDAKESTATLVVPATLVVMGYRTELTDLPTVEPTTETVVLGVDKPAESAAVEGTVADVLAPTPAIAENVVPSTVPATENIATGTVSSEVVQAPVETPTVEAPAEVTPNAE